MLVAPLMIDVSAGQEILHSLSTWRWSLELLALSTIEVRKGDEKILIFIETTPLELVMQLRGLQFMTQICD